MKKIFATITTTILLITIFTTPATARSWDWELPGSVSTIIEDQAEIKYPGDVSMQSYFRKGKMDGENGPRFARLN